MAAAIDSASLDEILMSSNEDVESRSRFIQALIRSTIWILVDRVWDGKSTPDKDMRTAIVSDGSNQQQAMLAVFTTRKHCQQYLSGIEKIQHPFKNAVAVPMTWVLLGITADTGIMVNPNSTPAFRILPALAVELRNGLQTNSHQEQIEDKHDASSQAQREDQENPLVQKIQEAIDADNIELAEKYIVELSGSGIEEAYVLSSKALIAKYQSNYPLALELLNEAREKTSSNILKGEFSWISAQVYQDAEDEDQAAIAFEQACAYEPENITYIMDLARFKSKQFQTDEALQILQRAIDKEPANPTPAIFRGSILMEAGQHEQALTEFETVIAKFPGSAGAHFNRAACLQMLGRIDDARAAYEKALTLDPSLDGHSQYAALRKNSKEKILPSDVYLKLLERRAAEGMPISTRIDSNFALAKLYDMAGDLDRSFDYLEIANTLKRSSIKWTMADIRENIDEMNELFDSEFIANFRDTAASELAPIFVLGMPRSGTTLTEQILAAHSKVNPGGELTFLGQSSMKCVTEWLKKKDTLFENKSAVIDGLRGIAEKYSKYTGYLQVPGKRFTDKMPGNYLNIGFIYLLFPKASIIHCRRNPIDNCLSCYERLFSKGLNFSYDMNELGEYYNAYVKTMKLWHRLIPADFILDFQYEQMVADPENQIRRLLNFCGLEFEEACMNFHEVKRTVTTASALQVRQPLYNTSVNRWQKYGARLDPLLKALGPELTGIES